MPLGTITDPAVVAGKPTASTPKLSYAQLVQLAMDAGLTEAKAKTAAAIATAESGARPRALNDRRPDLSYGLWQINMIDQLGPARRAQLGIATNDQLYDPATNARAMALISGGGENWSPWTTFTSGAYRQYLGGGADTTSNVGGSTGNTSTDPNARNAAAPEGMMPNPCLLGGSSTDVLPSFVPFGSSVNVPCLFYRSWGDAIIGATVLVIGGLILVVGVIVAASGTKSVRQAASTVAGFTPSGVAQRTFRSGGSVRPLQTEDEVATNNDLLARQSEALSQPTRVRSVDRHRQSDRSFWGPTGEEPF